MMDAYIDLKYLLNRGYRKSYALEFVGNHYRLSEEERYLLARCVFPDSWIDEVRNKLAAPVELSGKVLGIDGFNVLITLESLLLGEAILCEDGLIRDIRYVGKYRLHERTGELLDLIAGELTSLKVERAVFFYGKNVPKSGLVKRLTEEKLTEQGVNGEVRLVKSPDFELKGFEYVATADTGIIGRVPHVLDLPALIGERIGIRPRGILDLLSSFDNTKINV
ncbi:DUF434 domain-containing protein [Thermococcus sp.]